MAGFKTRFASAVVLVIVLGSALYFGSYYLWGLLLASSLIGLFEFYRAMRRPDEREKMKMNILEFVGYAGVLAYYLVMLFTRSEKYMFLTLIIILICAMIIFVLRYPQFNTA